MTKPFLIHKLFEKTVQKNPKNEAIRFQGESISYTQLNQMVNRIANALKPQITQGTLVGVCMDRSIEMIATIMAILKNGCGYLPLDPSYPDKNLQYMVDDSAIQFLVCENIYQPVFKSFNELSMVDSRELMDNKTDSFNSFEHDSLAYVIYTSGSTGNPKGVEIWHKGLSALFNHLDKNSRQTECEKTLQFLPLSFDPSFMEIFSTLCAGKTLVLIEADKRKDPERLLNLIVAEQIERIFLPVVFLNSLAQEAIDQQVFPLSLKEINCGGDSMKLNSTIIDFFSQLPDVCLNNMYGPTEASIMVTNHSLKGDPRLWPQLPSLGPVLDNIEIKLFNPELQELGSNEIGEIYIAGDCLAKGYWKKEPLTKERFITIRQDNQKKRFYRSGDLGEFDENKNLHFKGRVDDQVKVNGIRIELGEVEAKIHQLEGVSECAAVVIEDQGIKRFIAYYVGELAVEAVRKHLKTNLPATMVPHFIEKIDAFPLTSNGKIDKKKLPMPVIHKDKSQIPNKSTNKSAETSVKNTNVERDLLLIWEDVLKIEGIQLSDNFFEVGGNSLLAMKVISKIRKELNFHLTEANFFQYPNITKLAQFLTHQNQPKQQINKSNDKIRRLVAVVGMAGEFPGADNIEQYWDMIINNKEGIRFFSDDELDSIVGEQEKRDPNYIKARGYLKNSQCFDPFFFGMTPRTGELMDPQMRLMLEYAHRALENSGTSSEKTDYKIGVFSGMSNNTYYANNVLQHPEKINAVGEWTLATFHEKDYVSTQIAHKLGLYGPALSLHTACSTSLVAIAQAIRAIENGDCDMAIGGGVNINANPKTGYLYQEGGIRSIDGHCRPFDKQSTGTVFCDGIGMVVLKDYEAALKDGDQIYALVKGVGINNDGDDKVSFTAPSVNGQKNVIEMALNDQGIQPETIGFLEAHGTATPVGDPIEIEAVTQAWALDKQQSCVLSSVKGNIGHTIAAAGVAGFIKASLALHHKTLPPTIHFNQANPKIDFTKTPFRVNQQAEEWSNDKHPRRAAVSAFGVGGTNAHIILEEASEVSAKQNLKQESKQSLVPIPVSAKTTTALKAQLAALSDYLQQHMELSIEDISYTLAQGRNDYAYRNCLYADSTAQLTEQLKTNPTISQVMNNNVIFAFPGQGSQYLKMGQSLYQEFELFRDCVDHCAEVLNQTLESDIRDVLFGNDEDYNLTNALTNTYYTQPAVFVIEYALAKLLESFGVVPDLMVGHSVGEFAAATLAGTMQLDDALLMIAKRGELMQKLPKGDMLSVRTSLEEITPFLSEHIQLAAVNGPKLVVLAGVSESIDKTVEQLAQQGIQSSKLHTSHAFHSAMMQPIVQEFADFIDRFPLSSPSIPIFSTVSNQWVKEEMSSSQYWAQHVMKPVLFNPVIKELMAEDKDYTLLEIGPRNTLVTLSLQQNRVSQKKWACFDVLGKHSGQQELQYFLNSLGRMWSLGVLKDLPLQTTAHKVSLPEYCFEYKNLWLEPFSSDVNKNSQTKAKKMINTPLTATPKIHKKRGPSMEDLKESIISVLKEIFVEASGIPENELVNDSNFMELGFDSLLLTQLSQVIARRFECELSFRQIMDDFPTTNTLTDYLQENASASVIESLKHSIVIEDEEFDRNKYEPQGLGNLIEMSQASLGQFAEGIDLSADSVQALINRQLEIMQYQLSLLSGQTSLPNQASAVKNAAKNLAKQPGNAAKSESVTDISKPTAEEMQDDSARANVNTAKNAFGAQTKINTISEENEAEIEKNIAEFMSIYIDKTKASKTFTQKNRHKVADPRAVTGFRPEIKEITYPIVINKSKQQHLWDLDGNEYVDMICGFGSNFFGNQNERINKAIHEQVDTGYEIGPQHELVDDCAELFCEFTGLERVAFCNTGSEAVLGAIRTARTVTGKAKVAMFTGSYHGINDEVIVRGLQNGNSMPAAAGINRSAVSDILVLDYGTDESYEIIKNEIDNIAAVITESVQSRRPEFRPVEFLKKVRALTAENGVAMIFDEVITGFRNAPGGAQEYYGIKADIATYGKIIGGGLPIGVIAGSAQFMDALDGGYWEYGDDSTPTVGVTYFAGTFVRHPLALRSMREALLILKENKAQFYPQLNATATEFVNKINTYCELAGAPIKIEHFGGVLKPQYTDQGKNNDLFHAYMRYNGVHTRDGFPWFITMAHTEADLQFVFDMLKKSIQQMQQAGLFPHPDNQGAGTIDNFLVPPVSGARLGKDKEGNPAWFVEDEENPGKFLQLS